MKNSTDIHLSSAQQQCLSALLDTILPASEDGTMPSAGEMNFLVYLDEQAKDFMPAIVLVLDQLDENFTDAPLPARVARLEDMAKADKRAFNRLLLKIYDCYYQDDRVLMQIGALPGPPFPRGNVVEPGDLSLLDAVVARGHGYHR